MVRSRVLGLVGLVLLTGLDSGCLARPDPALSAAGAGAGSVGTSTLRLGGTPIVVRCVFVVETGPPRGDTTGRPGRPPPSGQGGPLPGISI